ncbi:MAG: HPr family phosphocarrier protein [Planctomycetaceae bacterium]|nr:HPr family phosphocarrier protein [Planctomycetaceae bacterium]
MSETAITRTVVVTDPAGVHARTAVAIAEVVRRGQATVTLIKDYQRVPATEVLQVLTLVAEPGETLQIEAQGPDANAVLDQLEPLFAGQFGEEAQPFAK